MGILDISPSQIATIGVANLETKITKIGSGLH
jgi:hypothetical protein